MQVLDTKRNVSIRIVRRLATPVNVKCAPGASPF
jgi:hypothetical protein